VQGALGLAHVDHLDRGQARAVDARGQAHAAQRVDRLGPRRGAAGDEHRAGLARTTLGHAARVVAWIALVLLVGGIVLLVDDDQPEVAQRRQHGGARADADARLAGAQARPLVVALARRELRVQDGDRVAEARHEARDDLRRQRDLRHEHDHVAPVGERRRGGAQVNLGLARAGHAVQEQALPRLRRGDRGERGLLLSGQRRRRARGADRHVQGRAADDPRRDPHQPAGLEAAQGGEVGAREARQRGEQRALAVGEALALVVAGRLCPQRRLRLRALRRQQQRERASGRRAVLGRHPHGQVDELGCQARVEHAPRHDGLVGGLVGQPRHDADDLARTEWHDEHRADVDALGPQVVERPTQHAGRRERLDLDYR
jgi:hypothetical protein